MGGVRCIIVLGIYALIDEVGIMVWMDVDGYLCYCCHTPVSVLAGMISYLHSSCFRNGGYYDIAWVTPTRVPTMFPKYVG